ncbi:MAG: hypothetical protein M0P71_14265 [Melioribacteraceae bacterium]|nr:hypothetical protein [Melioribacteraceae bacterium]
MSNSTTPMQVDAPSKDAKQGEVPNSYIFSQTGNICISTTEVDKGVISSEVREVFEEVTVFFAALTKALAKVGTSMYNYGDLNQIIQESGFFAQVEAARFSFKSTSVGATLSTEFVEVILGLANGSADTAFAASMVASMAGKANEITVNDTSVNTTGYVSNIIFVCEYLLGVPVISAVVTSFDTTDSTNNFDIGSCVKVGYAGSTWTYNKETYIFVTPAFIEKFAGSLSSAENDPVYLDFIDELASFISDKTVTIDLLTDLTSQAAIQIGGTVTVGDKITIEGAGFGDTMGIVYLGDKTVATEFFQPTIDVWTDNLIEIDLTTDSNVNPSSTRAKLGDIVAITTILPVYILKDGDTVSSPTSYSVMIAPASTGGTSQHSIDDKEKSKGKK